MSTDPQTPAYHFEVSFAPEWPAILPIIGRRARSLRSVIGDSAELGPLASGITIAGTRWPTLASGGLRFDVLEHRPEFRGNLVQKAGAVDEDGAFHFGLAHPERIAHGELDTFRSEVALGVWLRKGSLVLLPTEDAAGETVAEEVIAAFDVWEALHQLSQMSEHPPELVAMGEAAGPSTVHPSPAWAPEFTLRLRAVPGGCRAVLRHPCMTVGLRLQNIVERV